MPAWPGWAHHREGWRFALDALRALHDDRGVLFDGCLEDRFREPDAAPIEEPWTGFVHTVPHHPQAVHAKYAAFPDLATLLGRDGWRRSLPHCRGVFTLSGPVAHWLRGRLAVPVSAVVYPIRVPEVRFDVEKFRRGPRRVFHVGHWLRRTESFFALRADGYEKCLLSGPPEIDEGPVPTTAEPEVHRGVRILPLLSPTAFDAIFESGVLFLDLYDAAACTTVVECIQANAPLLVNRLPGIVEYLGEGYPLYCDGPGEASALLCDLDRIGAASRYLEGLEIKSRMTAQAFTAAVAASEVYAGLGGARAGGSAQPRKATAIEAESTPR